MSELDKLKAYLKEHKYVFRRIDKYDMVCDRHQLVVYDNRGVRQWDAICQFGSFGYEEGLLEIMGSIVDKKKDGDSVVGYLTAQDVIDRLEERNG